MDQGMGFDNTPLNPMSLVSSHVQNQGNINHDTSGHLETHNLAPCDQPQQTQVTPIGQAQVQIQQPQELQ